MRPSGSDQTNPAFSLTRLPPICSTVCARRSRCSSMTKVSTTSSADTTATLGRRSPVPARTPSSDRAGKDNAKCRRQLRSRRPCPRNVRGLARDERRQMTTGSIRMSRARSVPSSSHEWWDLWGNGDLQHRRFRFRLPKVLPNPAPVWTFTRAGWPVAWAKPSAIPITDASWRASTKSRIFRHNL
jgi:hypothetical protein